MDRRRGGLRETYLWRSGCVIHGKEGGICEGEVTRTGNCVEVPVGDTSLLCGEACHGKKEESVDRVQKMGYNERKRVNVLV